MRKYLTGNVYLIATLAVIAFAYGLSIGALADEQDARQPTLGDLMTLTQLKTPQALVCSKGKQLEACRLRIGSVRKHDWQDQEAVSHDIVNRSGQLEYTKKQTPRCPKLRRANKYTPSHQGVNKVHRFRSTLSY